MGFASLRSPTGMTEVMLDDDPWLENFLLH